MEYYESLSTNEDRAAYELCGELGFKPFTLIQKGERRCIGYEDDYYMNWARDKITEHIALQKSIAGKTWSD